jgi:ribosomal protein S18 acetylase RimI-like enzyme
MLQLSVIAGHVNPGERLVREVQRIYVASFPATERLEFADILESIGNGERSLHTACDGETVVGFAVTMPLIRAHVLLLEYLAVREDARNQGVGSTLLQDILETLRCTNGGQGILFEVEPPEDEIGPKTEMRKRRIEFYRRIGAEVVDDGGAYRMPDLSGEGSMPMRLMWLPRDPACKAAVEQHLGLCIAEIYRVSYRRQVDDPLLQSILQDLDVHRFVSGRSQNRNQAPV